MKSYRFQKMQGSNRLGRVLRCLSSPWHLGNLPCCGRAKCHATARDPMKFGWDSERFRRWTCSLRQAKDKVKFHLARLAYQGQLHKQWVILLDPFFVLKETVSLSEGHSWPCNFLVLLALLLPRTRKKGFDGSQRLWRAWDCHVAAKKVWVGPGPREQTFRVRWNCCEMSFFAIFARIIICLVPILLWWRVFPYTYIQASFALTEAVFKPRGEDHETWAM